MQQDRGFTLLELVIVVLIIGVLAAIAIPRFGSSRDKAYVAALKSDLRNLVTAQEAYRAERAGYATTTSNLTYNSSSGVTVAIGAADANGWNATATHPGSTKSCGIYIGTASAPVPGGQPGEAVCR